MRAAATDLRDHSPGPANRLLLIGLLLGYGLLWIGLAIDPVNRRDWLLENVLALAGVAGLLLTYRRFRFSNRSYGLIAVFLMLHAIGAHYTYAEVPFGFWLKEVFDFDRNPFDRIVHFSFGALLAYPMQEILVRVGRVPGLWASFLSVSVILSLSGLFEVIEAIVATVVSPELGALYLGTQGDEWDAQKDMAAALTGALVAVVVTQGLAKARTPHRMRAQPAHFEPGRR
jgi:putative membrane protein